MVKTLDSTSNAKKDMTYSYIGDMLIPFVNSKNKSLFDGHESYTKGFDNLNLGQVFEELDRLRGSNKKYIRSISRYDANLNYQIDSKLNLKKIFGEIQKGDHVLKHVAILNYDKLGDEFHHLFTLNSWLTFVINKIYLQYCKNNNIIPDARISVPEHLLHEVYLSSSGNEMLEKIINVVDNYIDDQGRVYSNCYAKFIKDTVKKVKREDNITLERFFPKYNQQFDIEIYYAEPKFMKSEKIPFKAQAAGRFLSRWVSPKYISHISRDVFCDEELCMDLKKYGVYFTDDYIFIHPRAATHVIAHELTHRVVDKNNLELVTNNFLFENAKGEIIRYDENNITKSRIKPLNLYASKLNSLIERYGTSNELLSSSMDYLLGGVQGNVIESFRQRNSLGYEKVISQLDKKIDENVSRKINRIYTVFPDLAIFILAYFNGEL